MSDCRKHVVIDKDLHPILKSFCAIKKIPVTSYVSQLIRDAIAKDNFSK